jgi:hypothetical protein
MTTFDPYHTWLGIPPDEQPPNHYRLLGIQVGESNDRVIADAADRQTAHLRTKQHSEHVADSQRLLNEVSRARVCLLNPESRVKYEQSIARPVTNFTPPPVAPSRRPKRPTKNPFVEVAKVVVGGLVGIAIAVGLVKFIYARIDTISEQKAVQIVATQTPPRQTVASESANDPLPPSASASLLKIYNSSNGHRGVTGAKKVNVVLKLNGDEAWREDDIDTAWEPKGSPMTSIPLPPHVRFDTLRIEIPEWHSPGCSLAEIEVYDNDGVNIAANQPVEASSFYLSKSNQPRDWRPSRLTEGTKTSSRYGFGYWVAEYNKPSWIEVSLTRSLVSNKE